MYCNNVLCLKIREHVKKKTIYLILIILSIELFILWGTNYYVKMIDKNAVDRKLDGIDNNILEVIEYSSNLVTHNIERNNAFVRIHGKFVHQKDFVDYINFNSFPIKANIDLFTWIPKIKSDEVDAYNYFCRTYINEMCILRKYDMISKTLVSIENGTNTIYWPFTNAEPYNTTNAIFGFDFSSHPLTYEIIENVIYNNNIFSAWRFAITQSITNNPYNYGLFVSKVAKSDDKSINSEMLGISSATYNIGNMIYSITNRYIGDLRYNVDILMFDITNKNIATNKTLNISLMYKENKKEYHNIWFSDEAYETDHKYNFLMADKKFAIYIYYSDEYTDKLNDKTTIVILSVLSCIFIIVDISIILYQIMVNMLEVNMKMSIKKKEMSTDMLSYFNHEVRNPLNVVVGLVELGLDQLMEFMKRYINESDDQNILDEFVEIRVEKMRPVISDFYTALSACQLMEHIVDDVLIIRTLEVGGLLLDNKLIKLDSFVHNFRKTVIQKISEKSEIKFEINCEKIEYIYIDEMRLMQIMLNFISNSLKFTDTGKISFNVYTINDMIRFEIEDTGRGIEDRKKQKIFARFSQVNVEDSTKHGGYGLGLYLCRSLGELMNGKIGFNSIYGKGSRFWIEFAKDLILQDDMDNGDNVKIHVTKI